MTIVARGKHVGKAVSLAEAVKRSCRVRQTTTLAPIEDKGQEATMTIVLAPEKPK